MAGITLNDIITHSLSTFAVLVSVCALAVSIWLPLHLAKRAEKRAVVARNKEKMPPFYRKVKEFAVHFNTPGKGYATNDVYYLSNEASELGLTEFQSLLLDLHHDLGRWDVISDDNHGGYNNRNEYVVNPKLKSLGDRIQRKLRVIHDMAESGNNLLHAN